MKWDSNGTPVSFENSSSAPWITIDTLHTKTFMNYDLWLFSPAYGEIMEFQHFQAIVILIFQPSPAVFHPALVGVDLDHSTLRTYWWSRWMPLMSPRVSWWNREKHRNKKNMVNGDWIVEQENMRLIKMMEVELFFLGKHADLSTEDFNLRNLWRWP